MHGYDGSQVNGSAHDTASRSPEDNLSSHSLLGITVTVSWSTTLTWLPRIRMRICVGGNARCDVGAHNNQGHTREQTELYYNQLPISPIYICARVP